MWFLIKGSIFFAAVLVVLSYFSNRPLAVTEDAGAVEMGDAISVATGAYSYIAGLCAEKPDVCAKGAETLSALGVRAAEGAHVAFELLDSHFNTKTADVALKQDPDPTPFPADAVQTRSIAPPATLYTGSVPLPLKRPIQ
ncbi:DUF5330 domain-containing protein [Aliirhizobium smilacinae]|uniref:DUF5330 domain-containing protein n=1 Tax=Aliirhizobium smilacinae TaxID=1395944 RepID=A0A5C4XQD9_9HYPH|nr:DUF5330 domain-containing protein [Rhizobium smilacinae]TNM65705.1 hypothetical protein FHP24_05520 [Rhizobium smilacinae]